MSSPAHVRKRLPRPLSLGKKLIFAALSVLIVSGLLEVGLGLAGIRPMVAARDPFVGFAANLPLFEKRAVASGAEEMVTAANKLAYFNAQHFAVPKPARTFRIFCMGGSTTYGRPYNDNTSFCGWLRELLPETAPDRKWEVINAGGVSYASYRVAALMNELVQYQPDLFIIYSGQNEFLEQRTYGEVQAAPQWRIRLISTLGHSRTFSLLHSLLKPAPSSPSPRSVLPGEVDAILDHTVGPSSYHRDDALKAKILKHYEFNLRRMTAIAHRAGAKVLFIVPASNLKDASPFKSQHSAGLSAKQIDQWAAHYYRGKALENQNNLAGALAEYKTAEQMDDRFALLHYRKGWSLFKAARLAEAVSAFQRALDDDICPLRALSSMSSAVRRVGRDTGAQVVDFLALLRKECLHRYGHTVLGKEFFLDHVHPTIEGHRLLAVAIVQALARTGVISPTKGPSDNIIKRVATRIESRIDRKAQGEALRNLAKVLNWAGKHEEAGPLALEALELLPDDPETLFLAAAYFKMKGNALKAIAGFEKTLELDPRNAEAHRLLGASLVEQKQYEPAMEHFVAMTKLDPKNGDAHQMIGALLAEMGRYEAALPHYDQALKFKPNDSNIHFNLGFALAHLNRNAPAIAHYRRAVGLNPADAEACRNLAELLLKAGQEEEAIGFFRKALKLRPHDADLQRRLARLGQEGAEN